MNEIEMALILSHDEQGFAVSSQTPTEIFYCEKYGGYFMRGQEITFSMTDVGQSIQKKEIKHFFRLRVVALVREDFQHNVKDIKQWPMHYGFGVLLGRNEEEFRDILGARQSLLKILSSGPLKTAALDCKPRDLETSRWIDYAIDPGDLLRNMINQRKEIIPLSVTIDFDHSLQRTDSIFFNTFAMLSQGFIDDSHERDINLVNFMREFHKILMERFAYKGMAWEDLENSLFALAKLFDAWTGLDAPTPQHIKWLNEIALGTLGREDALDFLIAGFFDDFVRYLLKNKELSRCSHCGIYFPYQKDKKYCSPFKDGRNCGKQARNRRFYEEHKVEIRRKAKKAMTELRKFYKQKGVKK